MIDDPVIPPPADAPPKPSADGLPPVEEAKVGDSVATGPEKKKKKEVKPKPRKYRLLIVESPAKAKTIGKFVGSRYVVRACMGHVRDLPSSRIGVDVENNFLPKYIAVRGKMPLIKELRVEARKAEMVYLAADPDREGEAICWHLKEILKLPDEKVRRVIFNEITKNVVKAAVEDATGAIDFKLVEAQQARRVLDRLVGYNLSPLLWTKVRRGLSAGRVQSVAMRLISEREDAVEAFNPREYWTIGALLAHDGSRPFEARLASVDGAKAEIATGPEAAVIVEKLKAGPFKILNVESKESRRNPPPPFITSTLQQEAAKRYRYTAKRTMMIAQTLYEGVDLGAGTREGLITYMRTDSVRVSAEAQKEAREMLEKTYGREILPAEPPVYKGRAGAQDAHEAIRPSYSAHEPEEIRKSLTPDQFKLYKLVWQRFLASQSAPAILEQTAVDVASGPGLFRATGVVTKFLGFMSLYKEAKDEDAPEDEAPEGALPAGMQAGTELELKELKPVQHFTQPPPRFSDASLIKELEEDGIGRPSTYAPTISTILDRGYIERREGRFVPTELGRLVNELLVKSFQNVINVDFTAQMEARLDEVAEGKTNWIESLRVFYGPFAADVEKAKVEMRNVKAEIEITTDIPCDKCGKMLIVRWGRHGKFLACPGYPACRNAKSYETVDGVIRVLLPEVTTEKCDKCGAAMMIRVGRFGKFLACQNYPECKTARPIPLDFGCPKAGCEGKLVSRRTRKGRIFFGCNKYPACDFVTWNAPVKGKCPKCGAGFLTERKLKGSRRLACPIADCGYELEEMNPVPGASIASEAGAAGQTPALLAPGASIASEAGAAGQSPAAAEPPVSDGTGTPNA
jgi:DNA topoisomerase-1